MRILMADDNADARMMLGAAFRAFGHTVTEATNGEEAVQVARDEQFDAMVLDIGMPLMNGWDATKIIRRIPHASTLPLILFTGYNQYFDESKAKAAGATLLLHKPFNPMTLVKLVEGYVARMAEPAASPDV
jgi:two-component system chemotaxis response regulator CheY